jgi:hypothetical protein
MPDRRGKLFSSSARRLRTPQTKLSARDNVSSDQPIDLVDEVNQSVARDQALPEGRAVLGADPNDKKRAR